MMKVSPRLISSYRLFTSSSYRQSRLRSHRYRGRDAASADRSIGRGAGAGGRGLERAPSGGAAIEFSTSGGATSSEVWDGYEPDEGLSIRFHIGHVPALLLT